MPAVMPAAASQLLPASARGTHQLPQLLQHAHGHGGVLGHDTQCLVEGLKVVGDDAESGCVPTCVCVYAGAGAGAGWSCGVTEKGVWRAQLGGAAWWGE